MDSILYLVVAVLGLSALIIIHEFGHFIVARAFGMRARVFSIGFGPTVAQWRPKGGETVYQIAAIPVLAYVNIAGMAIAFGLIAFGGDPMLEPRIRAVTPDFPAAAAGLRAGDRIVRVDNTDIARWSQLVERVSRSGGRTLPFVVERGGQRLEFSVTPRLDPASREYKAGVIATLVYAPVPVREAALRATVLPARVVVDSAKALRRMFQGQEKVRVMGPVGIVNEMVHEARRGWRDLVQMLWVISVSLFFLNLLPVPALDGGRAVFLGYEMLLRRKLPPRFEYAAVAVSMVILLGAAAVVMVFDVGNWRW